MRNRFLFRDDGQVVRTRSAATDAAFAFGAMALLVGLLAWGHAVDQRDAVDRAFEAGEVVGRQAMAESVGDAYRQGRLDAAAELQARGAQQASVACARGAAL